MYGVVDVDVDIVQKSVILVPVSAPFALNTLEFIINNHYMSKKVHKIIFNWSPNHPYFRITIS